MKKDYDAWNKVKKTLEKREFIPEFNERDVWWCHIGTNLGFEADGKHSPFERPVLVLRKYNKELFFGLPLTSVNKNNQYYFQLTAAKVRGAVMLSQGRVLSGKRMSRKMYRLDGDIFLEIIATHEKLFHKTTKIVPKKSKAPLKAGQSRAPFGDLYHNYSKPKAQSQPQKIKGKE
ncbi:type II toxin-antitoxin system PemK/MazF family toxin [Candidatus Saccharibacteria bacterium]|nr:type II toxin-antitoxin system PemK/MazF family toxin [Candidatus Saccharibacteria bacterium]